jgi:hypothetical protein
MATFLLDAFVVLRGTSSSLMSFCCPFVAIEDCSLGSSPLCTSCAVTLHSAWLSQLSSLTSLVSSAFVRNQPKLDLYVRITDSLLCWLF